MFLKQYLLLAAGVFLTGWVYGQEIVHSINSATQACSVIKSMPATPPISGKVDLLAGPIIDSYYGTSGTEVFSSFDSTGKGSFVSIPTSNSFWRNTTGSNGPLNRCGVWATIIKNNQSVGFSVCITIPSDKEYYMGFGVDNYATLKIDANVVLQQAPTSGQENLNVWRIYKIELSKGKHYVEILGHNPFGPASIGFEIYDNTLTQLMNATSYNDLNLIFSSKDQVGKPLQDGDPTLTYSCPAGYSLDYCSSNIPLCSKIITDTFILSVKSPLPDCKLDSADITAPLITGGSSADLSYSYWADTMATIPLNDPNDIKVSGIYYIVGKSPGGCSITEPVTVTILDRSNARFSVNNPVQCLNGNKYVFTNNSIINSGSIRNSWLFGDGGTSAMSSPSYTYSVPGKYSVKLLVTADDGCMDSIAQQVQVYPNPQPSLYPARNLVFCSDDSLQVICNLSPDGARDHTYQWYEDGATIGAPKGTASGITISKPGNYGLKVINTYGCDSSIAFSVKMNSKKFTMVDTAFCLGRQSYGGHSYSGTYTDTYTGSNGCDSIRTLHLSVYPTFMTRIDTTICGGNAVEGYTTAGVHTDNFTSVHGCDSVRVINLTVIPLPNPWQGSLDTGICNGQVIRLSPGKFDSYSWQDGSSDSTFIVSGSGNYSVTVTNRCGTQKAVINVKKENCKVEFPNAFTPGGYSNKVFRAVNGYDVKDFHLRIFDREGQRVFETSDISRGWDGTINGKRAEPGTYVWDCEFLKPGDTRKTIIDNTVILVR